MGAILSSDRVTCEVITLRDAKKAMVDLKLARSAANQVILDGVSSGLQSLLRSWDPAKDGVALRSRLITTEAFEALVARDDHKFLALRATTLIDHVSRFLDQKAQWDAPVIRPQRYYTDNIGTPTQAADG